MKHTSATFTYKLIAIVLAISVCAAVPLTASAAQPATDTTESAPSHFDAQYEDNGIKVYITKVFPQYQMQEGQMSTASDSSIIFNALQISGIPMDTHRIFHSVADDTTEVWFTPIMAGTRMGIAAFAKRENTNKIVGSIGAVAMFALSRGMSGGSSNALSNLSGLRDVVGTGMLKAADFKDSKIGGSENQGIQAGADDIIYVSKLKVKHSQTDVSLGDSVLYFVMHKEMKHEVLNDGNLREYYQSGSVFTNVLSNAVLKAANLNPYTKTMQVK